ncbi:MAG: C4-type zinc ribbon domain-containing protein [Chloroflexota bacterium]
MQQWLQQLQKAQRDAEAEADDLEAKVKQVAEKLYSGRVTNLKELAGLQEEHQQLKAKLWGRENRVLEVMGEIEVAQQSLQSQRWKLKQVESQWHGEQERLAGEQATLQETLARLEQNRQRLAAEIDPAGRQLYEELRLALQGRAVARVEQGRCQGCRLGLSVAELQRVRGSGLVQCSTCQRILCLD